MERTVVMQTKEELSQIIEKYLSQTSFPDEPERLYAPILYSLQQGGKRLRPLLVMLACNIFSDETAPALPCAAAVEVFHNFTLLHDDIMDNAPMRRGKPSVYKKWNQNVAILSGDAMMIYSYMLLNQAPAGLVPQILERFNRMAMQVCEGQQYDMDFENRDDVPIEEYMKMIELKTSVLLAASAEIGAIIGGASEEDCRKLYRFAIELGLAFQVQDDLLDSYGDSSFGKPIGGDIVEGKKTFLMINALSKATAQERAELRSLPGDAAVSREEKIRRVKAIYERCGVKTMAENQVKRYMARAEEILDSLSVAPERLTEMKSLVAGLLGRNK